MLLFIHYQRFVDIYLFINYHANISPLPSRICKTLQPCSVEVNHWEDSYLCSLPAYNPTFQPRLPSIREGKIRGLGQTDLWDHVLQYQGRPACCALSRLVLIRQIVIFWGSFPSICISVLSVANREGTAVLLTLTILFLTFSPGFVWTTSAFTSCKSMVIGLMLCNRYRHLSLFSSLRKFSGSYWRRYLR